MTINTTTLGDYVLAKLRRHKTLTSLEVHRAFPTGKLTRFYKGSTTVLEKATLASDSDLFRKCLFVLNGRIKAVSVISVQDGKLVGNLGESTTDCRPVTIPLEHHLKYVIGLATKRHQVLFGLKEVTHATEQDPARFHGPPASGGGNAAEGDDAANGASGTGDDDAATELGTEGLGWAATNEDEWPVACYIPTMCPIPANTPIPAYDDLSAALPTTDPTLEHFAMWIRAMKHLYDKNEAKSLAIGPLLRTGTVTAPPEDHGAMFVNTINSEIRQVDSIVDDTLYNEKCAEHKSLIHSLMAILYRDDGVASSTPAPGQAANAQTLNVTNDFSALADQMANAESKRRGEGPTTKTVAIKWRLLCSHVKIDPVT